MKRTITLITAKVLDTQHWKRGIGTVDIELTPASQHFQPIGTATLPADGETTIQIQTTGTTGFVILDAVQLVK